jgi:tetratricopeptide (TPR) repeat protein
MPGEIEPPPGILGFGNCLLWLLATSAAEVIDALYRDGPAHRLEEYQMLDGHDLPTQSVVAWLLLAAENGVWPVGLAVGDKELASEQRRWRALIAQGMRYSPRRFKEAWIDRLAEVCALTEDEVRLLKRRRLGPGYEIDVAALRKAVVSTRADRAAMTTSADGHVSPGNGADSVGLSSVSPPKSPNAGRGRAVPRMLPRSIGMFTGREPELRVLTDAAQHLSKTPGVVDVYVIEGMGGVGKTVLALQGAHRIASRFPDGQLFIDLQGYTADVRSVAPEEALGTLLGMLGWPAESIPPNLPERAALYRGQLAGTRTLIVLDNAASLDQVEPLIPGEAGCLVIVTCRRALGLNGARPVPLGMPPQGKAVDIFRAAAGPGRVASDDPNVAGIVALCECLPLALVILATRLVRRPALSTAEILAELREEHRRLARLADTDRNVTAVLELSYRHLPEQGQRMFESLGLIPGPDFGIDAVTTLFADADTAAIRSGLDSLLDHNLLIQQLHGRYRFHDLVRVFARMKSAAVGQDGLDRLMDFYLYWAQAADSQLDKRIPPVSPRLPVPVPRADPGLVTAARAREWLRIELPSLEAALREAEATGRHAHAVALSQAIAEHLRANGPWEMARGLHELALEAATQAGDSAGRAAVLIHTGVIERQTGKLVDAVGTLSRVAAANRQGAESGAGENRLALAGALVELGLTLRLTAEYDQAEKALTHAHEIYSEDENLLGQAAALRELGAVQRQASRFDVAERSLITARGLYEQVGNRYGQASTLSYLGGVRLAVKAYEPACEALNEAQEIYTDLDDQIGQVNCLLYLGKAHSDFGALEAAEQVLTTAKEISERLGDRRNLANASAFLGDVQRMTGNHRLAEQFLTEALRVFEEIGDLGGMAETMNYYAALALASRSVREASHRYVKALRLARKIESPRDQADALEGIANCRLAEGLVASARRHYEKARALYESMHSPTDETRIRVALEEIASTT